MPAVAKLCTLCGDDVTAKKRLRDPHGKYYCEPCAKRMPSAHIKGPHAMATAPVSLGESAAPAAPPPPPDDVLDFAPVAKAEAEEPMMGCAGCKKVVPERQVRNVDGEFLCRACINRRNAPSPRSAPASKQALKPAVGREEDDENPERWTDSFAGGLVVSAIVLAAFLGLCAGINLLMPDPTFGKGLLRSLGFGLFSTIWITIASVALLLSMLLTSKIMGGISFGTVGTAFYKAIAMCAAIYLFDHFSAHNETLGMINMGFGGGVYVLGFIFLFRLDFVEAIVLTVINWVLAFLLKLAALFLVAAIFVGAATVIGGGSDEDMGDEDEEMVEPGNEGAQPAGGGGAEGRGGAVDEEDQPA
jgi:hypothetical protein